MRPDLSMDGAWEALIESGGFDGQARFGGRDVSLDNKLPAIVCQGRFRSGTASLETCSSSRVGSQLLRADTDRTPVFRRQMSATAVDDAVWLEARASRTSRRRLLVRAWSIQMLMAWLLLAGGRGFTCRAAPADANSTLDGWQRRLRAYVTQPHFQKAQWGVKVASLDTGRTLFEYNAHQFFQPASNAKLFTAALVLDHLGPDYRIRTEVSSNARPDEAGVIHGDVHISGRGDPTFSARWHEGDAEAALYPLVAVFTNAGVRCIEGDLVGDEGFLHPTLHAPGWMRDDLERSYGAQSSALSFDDNSLKIRVLPGARVGAPCQVTLLSSDGPLQIVNQTRTSDDDVAEEVSVRRPIGTDTVILCGELQIDAEAKMLSVPVALPARFFMENLAAVLRRHGVIIKGRVYVRSPWSAAGDTAMALGHVESPPMIEVLHEMLKESDNLAASLLFAHVEACSRGTGKADPQMDGFQQVYRFLKAKGLPADEAQIEEGSGLSRNSLATPNAMVALLEHMSEHENGKAFVEALPLAGVDGTLKKRFVNAPVMGNLRAKTGTLRWAQALSGYVTSQAGERLAFSILLNRYLPAGFDPTPTDEVDTVALLVASLGVRSTGQ